MSEKVLKIAGRRPMLLALIVMATITIGLMFSGWLTPAPGRAQPSQQNPDPGLEMSTNCDEGWVRLSAPTNTPSGYIGSPMSVVPGVTVQPALVTIVLTNQDRSTTNLACYQIDPAYNVTWTMNGVAADTSSGTGTPAMFTPSNSGCGTVEFTVTYTNQSPCGHVDSSRTSGTFSVAELSTNCTSGTMVLGNSSSSTNLCFGSVVSLSVTNNNYTNAIWVTTHDPCGVNADTYSPTNFVAPTILSNWWTATVGSYSASGTGLSASFTPTNGGCGAVTFNLAYINNTPCDTNVYYPSFTLGFSVAQFYTNCNSGTIALGPSSTNANLNFGSGAMVSLSATNNNVTNAIVVTTLWPCTANTSTVTNFVAPTILSNWWTAGVGSYSASGTGLSASFTPTNGGCGTVTFNLAYINNTPCDTNVYKPSVTLNFAVAQLLTNCTSGTVVLGSSTTNLNFGPGAGVNLSVANNKVTNSIVVTTHWPWCSTNVDTFKTNFVSPTIVSNWWTASVGSYSTNGTGLSASFMPTNGGCGSATFYETYINNTPCDTNVYGATPCTLSFSVAQLYTNCTSGVLVLGNGSSTTNFWFATNMNVSLSVTNNNITNAIVVTTHWPCSTNVDTYLTNLVTPSIITNWWTLNYGGCSTNGKGLSVSFAPTNAGSGTVTFNLIYTNNTPCDTNVYNKSLTVPFNVIQLTSQCEATTPTNQARTTIGVGELVDLNLVAGPSSTTWAITSGGGSLSITSGPGTKFTAPGTNDSCTVTANYPGSTGCSTVSFNVIEPDDVKMVADGNYRHTNNWPNIGMEVNIYIMPDSVNFGNVSEIEEKANAVADGYFICQNGKPHDNNPQSFPNTDTVIPGLGTKANAVDHVWSGWCGTAPPFGAGTETVTIPWDFRVGANSWKKFTTLTHSCTFDGSQTLNVSKDSASWQCNITNQPVWGWQ